MQIEAEKKEIIGFVVIIFIVGGILISNASEIAYNQILRSASMIVIDTAGSFMHLFLCNGGLTTSLQFTVFLLKGWKEQVERFLLTTATDFESTRTSNLSSHICCPLLVE